MKTFYKTLTLGVFMAALAVVSPTFAQDPCADIEGNTALYETYTTKYKGTLEEKKAAAKAGNEYVQKYGACADFAQQVDYLKKAVPKLEEVIAAEGGRLEAEKRIERFNAAGKAGNAAELFASGEDILKTNPDQLDVILVLASVGLDEAAVKQNDTFNNKAIEYAKSAIKKMESGTKSEKFGAFGYTYNNKDNAIGWMNYTIGYIEYYRQKKEDSGLGYLYKATQVNSETKDRAFIYEVIGTKYAAKAEALNKEIVDIITREKKETFESKTKFALSKGYVDRAIEAYAKAYEVEKANAAKETDATKKAAFTKNADALYTTLKNLYKFRYETVDKPIADVELVQQLNSHIASVVSKPLASPSSEVQPVDPPTEEEETDTNTSSGTTSTTTPAKTETPATTGTPAKTATNGTADKATNKPKQR